MLFPVTEILHFDKEVHCVYMTGSQVVFFSHVVVKKNNLFLQTIKIYEVCLFVWIHCMDKSTGP